MEQENKEMRQTIIYLENLYQTLTAQMVSARQDTEIQTQVREVMFRELKGEIKDFQEENEELKTRLDYYVEENKKLEARLDYYMEKTQELQREIKLEKKVVANRLNYYMEDNGRLEHENKKLKDKIEELCSTPEIPEIEKMKENYREEIRSLERHVCNLQTEIDILMGR